MIDKNKKSGRKKNKKEKVFTVGRIILLTVLSLLMVFLILVYIFLNFYKPPQNTKVDIANDPNFLVVSDSDIEGEVLTPPVSPQSERNRDCYTFLIAGIDVMGGTTDTLMIAMFNTKDYTISVLNIPRDTYVRTSGHTGKINGVYSRGRSNARSDGITDKDALNKAGMEYLEKMITFTFGITIDRHVLINLEGLQVLVDKIGGVSFDVPLRMKYDDPDQNLHINLQAGVQDIDGKKAEQLIRFRHGNIYSSTSREPNYYDIGYPGEDIGRIKTQQAFMAAIAKKIFDNFSMTTIKNLFDVGSKYMTTNISVADISSFGPKLTNVKPENIRFIFRVKRQTEKNLISQGGLYFAKIN